MKSERVIVLALIWTKWIPDVFRNTLVIQARACWSMTEASAGGRGVTLRCGGRVMRLRISDGREARRQNQDEGECWYVKLLRLPHNVSASQRKLSGCEESTTQMYFSQIPLCNGRIFCSVIEIVTFALLLFLLLSSHDFFFLFKWALFCFSTVKLLCIVCSKKNIFLSLYFITINSLNHKAVWMTMF